jgi:uncharacterized membrane protein YukC
MMKKYLFNFKVWFEQLANGRWRWYISPQGKHVNSFPTYGSTATFLTREYALQNAKIRLKNMSNDIEVKLEEFNGE